MNKKINVLGIEIDNYTVRESMLQVDAYLINSIMNVINVISLEMLVKAGSDDRWKAYIEEGDLTIVGEKEILQSANIRSFQRIREVEEQDFVKEFLKKLKRGGRSIYILGRTQEEIELLRRSLEEGYGKVIIVGESAMQDCIHDNELIVNEVNVAAPDVIISILPVLEQVQFLSDNRNKLSGSVWIGLGDHFLNRRGTNIIKEILKKLIHKGIFKRKVTKYNSDKEE